MAEEVISWTVGGSGPRERSTDWYWGLGVLAVAGAAVSVFFGNTLLAIIILLGAGSIGFLAAQGPREHVVSIDARGITIDGTRYLYSSVKSFWVSHEENPWLFLTMGSVLLPHFSFPLHDKTDTERVRTFLLRFVPEEEQGFHVGDRVAEIFGL